MSDSVEVTLEHIADEIKDLKSKSASDRVWDLATKAAVPVMILISGWMIAIHVRVAVIEANQFTSKDGQKLQVEIMRSVPPVWLKEDLNEIKLRLTKLEELQRTTSL